MINVANGQMRAALVALREHQHQIREKLKRALTNAERRDFVDSWFHHHDTLEDDPHAGPRFSCPECQDTGLVGTRRDGRYYAGHCHCKRGEEYSNRSFRNGRQLGPGSTKARPNYVAGFDEFNNGSDDVTPAAT